MPGTIWTSSHPSAPKLSRICLVLCTSTGAVRYSHVVMVPTVLDRAMLAPTKVQAVALSTSLHIVSGKGGTGKTTVAAALATALADAGKRVLLCEVEGRQGIAQLFDVPPLPYEERKIAVGLGGGEVCALAIDAESALL